MPYVARCPISFTINLINPVSHSFDLDYADTRLRYNRHPIRMIKAIVFQFPGEINLWNPIKLICVNLNVSMYSRIMAVRV